MPLDKTYNTYANYEIHKHLFEDKIINQKKLNAMRTFYNYKCKLIKEKPNFDLINNLDKARLMGIYVADELNGDGAKFTYPDFKKWAMKNVFY